MTDSPDVPEGSPARQIECFVIGPIGDRLADHGTPELQVWEDSQRVLERVILPACNRHHLRVTRSDLITEPGEIPEQVFELLRDADLVIADVSGANANVMYELGMRHTLHKCTIPIGEHGKLPFDITVIRTIEFRRSNAGLIDARDELIDHIQACLDGRHRPLTPTRVWSHSHARGQPTTTALEPTAGAEPPSAAAEPVDASESGEFFLERLADMEEALPALSDIIVSIGTVGMKIGVIMNTAQGRIQDLEAQGQNSAAARLNVVAGVGSQLGEIASELTELVDSYESQIARADGGLTAMMEVVQDDPGRLPELADLPASVHEAALQIEEAVRVTEGSADQIADLSRLARPLHQPTLRIANELRRFGLASAVFAVWDSRFQATVRDAQARS